MRFLDGTVYGVRGRGTTLDGFSAKQARLVVSVYQDDRAAFAYPLSTKKPKRTSEFPPVRIAESNSYLVTDRGLFEIPLHGLEETGWRYSEVARLAAVARKDLRQLGVFVEAADDGPLRQLPFTDLKTLRRPAETPPPSPPETDEELFERYLRWFEKQDS
jgi:hypothetical protein